MSWTKFLWVSILCALALGCGTSTPSNPVVDRRGYTPLCPAEEAILDYLTDVAQGGVLTPLPQIWEILKEMKKTHPDKADALSKKITELSKTSSRDEIKNKAKAIMEEIVQGQQGAKP